MNAKGKVMFQKRKRTSFPDYHSHVLKVNESDVMQDVDQALSSYHIFHWRNNTGTTKIGRRFIRFGYPGSSDWLGVCPDGRFLAVECKAPKTGRVTEKQQDFLDLAVRYRDKLLGIYTMW